MYHDSYKKLSLRGGRRAGAGRKRLPEELKRQRRAMRKQITISWNVSREWEDKKLAFGMKRDKEFLHYILKQARPVEEEEKENPLGNMRSLVSHFADLRRENKLCDAVLQAKTPEGLMVNYAAHKVILLITSRYFQSLSAEDLKTKCEFFLQDVSPKGLGLLLDFMYGLKIDTVSHYACIEEIVNAATVLQVECYLKQAKSIIKRGRKMSEMNQVPSHVSPDCPVDFMGSRQPQFPGSEHFERQQLQTNGCRPASLSPGEQDGAKPTFPGNFQLGTGSENHINGENATQNVAKQPSSFFNPSSSDLTCPKSSLLNQSGGECPLPPGNDIMQSSNTPPVYVMMPGVSGMPNMTMPSGLPPPYPMNPVGFLPGFTAPSDGQNINPTNFNNASLGEVRIKQERDVRDTKPAAAQYNGVENVLDFSKPNKRIRKVKDYFNTHDLTDNLDGRDKTGSKSTESDKNCEQTEPIDLSKVKSEPPEDCFFGYKTPPMATGQTPLSAGKNHLHQPAPNRGHPHHISSESVVSPSAARAAASVVDVKNDYHNGENRFQRFEESSGLTPLLVRHQEKTKVFRYRSFLTSRNRYRRFLHPLRSLRVHGCEVCGRKYAKDYELQQHLQIIHKYKRQRKHFIRGVGNRLDHIIFCSFCNRDFISRASLGKHVKELHLARNQRFKCDKCPRRFILAASLQRHRGYKHRLKSSCEKPTLDVHGSMFFPNQDVLPFTKGEPTATSEFSALPAGRPNDSLSTNPTKAQWICHLCSLVYNQRSLLVKHLQIVHTIETPNVPLNSNSDTPNRPNYTFKARWICHVCSLYFGHRWSLLKHLQTVHRIRNPQVQPVYRRSPHAAETLPGADDEPEERNAPELRPKTDVSPAAAPAASTSQSNVPIFPQPLPMEKTPEPMRPVTRHMTQQLHATPPSSGMPTSDYFYSNYATPSLPVITPPAETRLETRASIQAPAFSQMTFKLIKSKNNDSKSGDGNYTLKLWPRKEMVSFGNKCVYKCPQCSMPFTRIQCFSKHMTKVHGVPFAMAQVNMDQGRPIRGHHRRERGNKGDKKEMCYNFKEYVPPGENLNPLDTTKFRAIRSYTDC